MFKSFRKNFESEIEALKSEDPNSVLHPLRSAQIKQNILKQIQNLPQTKTSALDTLRSYFESGSSSVMQYAFVALLLFTVTGISTISAANKAMPGDKLYGVKLTAEQLQYTLTLSQEGKAKVQSKIIEARIQENIKLESNLKSENTKNLNNAIETLQSVQIKLEEKGNTQAASSVESNIQRFKQRAAELDAKVNVKLETEDEANGNGQVKGSSNTDRGNSEDNRQDQDKSGTRNDENNRENENNNRGGVNIEVETNLNKLGL